MQSVRKLDQQINIVAESLELKKHTIIRLLNKFSNKTPTPVSLIASIIELPQTHTHRFLQAFINILDLESEQVSIKPEMLDIVTTIINKYSIEDNQLNKKLTKILGQYTKLRPTPERKFDQFYATPDTTIKRIDTLIQAGDILNRRIAFLGDDDLTSVAAALSGQAAQVTVFEIDPRIVEIIETLAAEHKLTIQIIPHDLREPINREWLEHFDVIFTDPPYTANGISLFVNRGIELLRPKLTSRIYFCYGNSDRARERELEVQKIISDQGLLINTKLPNYNHYEGAKSIGGTSSLYICDWSPRTKTTATSPRKIYTYE